MRVLIHEHFTSGGRSGLPRTVGEANRRASGRHHGGEHDDELLAAGRGMLRPFVADVLDSGADVTVTLAPGLAIDLPPETRVVTSDAPAQALAAALAQVDAAIVIAPESDDALVAATAIVERSGVRNLGASGDAVQAVADKLLLARRLAAAGLPTPATVGGLAGAPMLLEAHAEVVVKPRRSAGCVDTFVCRHEDDLLRLPDRDDWLVQERVPGVAASAAFVVTADGIVPLRAGRQAIASSAGVGGAPARLSYAGGRLPLDADLEARAVALGRAAIERVPGLRGFVGVDLVLGRGPSDDRLIEINPRLTVAYAALRALARFSIAALILGRDAGRHHGVWRSGNIGYGPAGDIAWDA